MKFKNLLWGLLLVSLAWSCQEKEAQPETAAVADKEFEYVAEQFADLRVLRYQIHGFDELTLKEKQLVYYLTQAGLAGRDIIWDVNYRHNLAIRSALENIYTGYEGDKDTEDWAAFTTYMKRVWFSNGIHHHYINYKYTEKVTLVMRAAAFSSTIFFNFNPLFLPGALASSSFFSIRNRKKKSTVLVQQYSTRF